MKVGRFGAEFYGAGICFRADNHYTFAVKCSVMWLAKAGDVLGVCAGYSCDFC